MDQTFKTSLLFIAGATALLAGCTSDGEPAPTADFGAASAEVRRTAIETGIGLRATEAYLAILQAEIHAEQSELACPARTYAEHSMTISADGCTTDDGYRYRGRVVATNAITLRDLFSEEPNVDPANPMILQFEDFRIEGPDGVVAFDGHFEQSSPLADSYRAVSSLTVTTRSGLVVQEYLITECDTQASGLVCRYTDGEVEIPTLGTFAVTGTIGHLEDHFGGSIGLHGVQELVVDLNGYANGCYPYSIDGQPAGELCDPEEIPYAQQTPGGFEARLPYQPGVPEAPLPVPRNPGGEPTVVGASVSCTGPALDFEATITGDVDRVVGEILGPRTVLWAYPVEMRPLSATSITWTGRLDLTPAYEITCEELSEAGIRLILFSGGERTCVTWGEQAWRFPADCADW